MRPRQRFLQNQHTRKVISTQKTSHKHNHKDPSRLRYLSPGMHVNTRSINSTRGTPSRRCTYGGVYGPCIWGCNSCGIYVPCIYAHARWQSLQVEFMYLVFTRMPGDSHCRWLRSLLLCLCDIFRALRELSMCVDIPRNISFLHAWLASPPAVWLLNSDHFSVLLCRKMSKQSTTKHDPMKKQHQ